MRFILTGFTQDVGFRVFAFERIGENRTRMACTVRADLGLSRRYGIQMQELPLLCRGLLERRDEGDGLPALTFTEDEMRMFIQERKAAREAAAQKRKPRKPIEDNPGGGWRTPQA